MKGWAPPVPSSFAARDPLHGLSLEVAGVGLGGLYDTQVNGVNPTDWIRDLLAHTQAAHVGP